MQYTPLKSHRCHRTHLEGRLCRSNSCSGGRSLSSSLVSSCHLAVPVSHDCTCVGAALVGRGECR